MWNLIKRMIDLVDPVFAQGGGTEGESSRYLAKPVSPDVLNTLAMSVRRPFLSPTPSCSTYFLQHSYSALIHVIDMTEYFV